MNTKTMMLESLNDHAKGFDEIFQLHIPNSVEPSLFFVPDTSGVEIRNAKIANAHFRRCLQSSRKKPDELAFASVRELAELVRTQKISSVALTANVPRSPQALRRQS